MSVQDAFRNMLNRIADHFLDMAAQMIAAVSTRNIGLFGNLFSGTFISSFYNQGFLIQDPEQQLDHVLVF